MWFQRVIDGHRYGATVWVILESTHVAHGRPVAFVSFHFGRFQVACINGGGGHGMPCQVGELTNPNTLAIAVVRWTPEACAVEVQVAGAGTAPRYRMIKCKRHRGIISRCTEYLGRFEVNRLLRCG